jgi:hypothetical protein
VTDEWAAQSGGLRRRPTNGWSHEVGERVGQVARERLGLCRVATASPMPGGHSGLTHAVELLVGGKTQRVIVKSTPPGRRPQGRHDVLRQARVIAAVRTIGDVPVPGVLFHDSTPPPWFAMELMPGSAREPVLELPQRHENAVTVTSAATALDVVPE